MSTGISPVRVASGGRSGRVGALVWFLALGLVVSIGVLGGTHGGPQPSPANSAAPLAAVGPAMSPASSPQPPSAQPASERPTLTPQPSPTPLPVSGEGRPAVTSSSATLLSGPSRPAASGLETVWPSPAFYWRAAADGHGIVWAASDAGGLARYDPGTGKKDTWSIDDDSRFAADLIAPSRSGGVWLVAGPTVRRFDGSSFGASYALGARVTAATEAPDGSLWAATADGSLVRLEGARRTRVDALAPAGYASINSIAVDARGDVWCAWSRWTGDSGAGWLARYDGAAWRVFDDDLGSAEVTALAALTDGTVWASANGRLSRFDGSGWKAVGAPWPPPTAMAAGLDGKLWVTSGKVLGNYAGLAWHAVIGPRTSDDVSAVVATRDTVLVAAGGSVYRRAGDSWTRVLAARSAGSSAPQFATALLAVSRNEAWVAGFDQAGGNAVWHAMRDGDRWSPTRFPTSGQVMQEMLRTPDGTLWATDHERPPSILQGKTWTAIGDVAAALALGPDGTVWASIGTVVPAGVQAYGLKHGTWIQQARVAWMEFLSLPQKMAVGGDGTIWVVGGLDASPTYHSTLARHDGAAWSPVEPPAGHDEAFYTDLAIAANGDVWVEGYDPTDDGRPARDWIARFDGTSWDVSQPAEALGLTTADPYLFGWYMPFYRSLAVGPDGTVWVASKAGLFRCHARAWTALWPGIRFDHVSVARDGTVWVSGPWGVARLASQPMLP